MKSTTLGSLVLMSEANQRKNLISISWSSLKKLQAKFIGLDWIRESPYDIEG